MLTQPCQTLPKEAANPSTLETVKSFALNQFNGASGSHDWEHTLRVVRLCKRIGLQEGVDMDVLLSAGYLHDIGRSYQDAAKGAVCHAEKGEKLAAPLITGLDLSDAQKDNIRHCIRSHRFRGKDSPATPEARVLFDADKIDAIGAVGIARAYLFAGELGARLHNPDVRVEDAHPYSQDDTGYREYMVKLSKIKDRIRTETGRAMAQDRHRFMEQFFQRFIQEFNGER
ncbi:MAG: HD domain-containing protein [Deltaproteobacteria bacterium]|nr:HD domain-containing protein [Deltaproteobacteria bacterium]